MSNSGVAAMVQCAAYLQGRLDMHLFSIGRSADDKEDCVLEICGKWLAYRNALRGGWVFVSAQLMDAGDSEQLLSVGDGTRRMASGASANTRDGAQPGEIIS